MEIYENIMPLFQKFLKRGGLGEGKLFSLDYNSKCNEKKNKKKYSNSLKNPVK